MSDPPRDPGVQPGRLRHILALDGLRGLAVIGVLLFHSGHLDGGYLGVDLFFVLSGFLITGLLLAEHAEHGRISLGRFWARRARRLLPAMLLVVLAAALYAVWWATPLELDRIRGDALATLGYVANWRHVFSEAGYWDQFRAPSPLEHTWSLAIEEQFYLFWPLVVVAVLRVGRGSWRAVLVTAAVLAAASGSAMVLLHTPGADPSRVYEGTDTRIAAILLGACLGVVLHRTGPARSRRARATVEAAGLAGAGVLVLAWFSVPGTTDGLYEGGLFGLGLAAVAVIAAAAQTPAGLLARLLSWRPLRACGLVSYGLYLWHWPVYVVMTEARVGLEGWSLTAARVAVSAALAVVSYVVVEKPIRFGALRPRRAGGLATAGAAAAVLAVLAGTAGATTPSLAGGGTFALTQPVVGGGGPPPTQPIPTVATTASSPDAVMATGTGTAAASVPAATVGPAATRAAGLGIDASTAIVGLAPPAPRRVMIVGDSGAAFLGEGLVRVQGEFGTVVLARGWIGCGMFRGDGRVRMPDGVIWNDPDGCHDWEGRWLPDLAAFDPDVVLVHLAWPGFGDRYVDGQWRHPCEPEFDTWYLGEVGAALDVLGSSGARLVIADAPYWQLFPLDDGERVDCLNAVYVQAAREHGADVIGLREWLCPDRRCDVARDDVVLRPDGVHFMDAGADIAGRWVLGEITRRLLASP